MVQWLCRAPHLEQYFLLSLDIFKRNFKDVDVEARSGRVAAIQRCLMPPFALPGWQVLSVQREMQKMQKEFEEGPPDDETVVTWTFEVVNVTDPGLWLCLALIWEFVDPSWVTDCPCRSFFGGQFGTRLYI